MYISALRVAMVRQLGHPANSHLAQRDERSTKNCMAAVQRGLAVLPSEKNYLTWKKGFGKGNPTKLGR